MFVSSAFEVDFFVAQEHRAGDDVRVHLRGSFDLLNHANFGQPGRVVESATFGQISNTRFPTGDSGSSRQLQLALKFLF